jgi:hypothetical protein
MKLEKEKATAERLESQIRNRFVEYSTSFGHFCRLLSKKMKTLNHLATSPINIRNIVIWEQRLASAIGMLSHFRDRYAITYVSALYEGTPRQP